RVRTRLSGGRRALRATSPRIPHHDRERRGLHGQRRTDRRPRGPNASFVSGASFTGGDIDIVRARNDTPGCANVAHLNNAGAALPDGVRVGIVPDDHDGAMDVQALAGMLDDRVRVVALTHVPSQNGLVNPAAAVGAVTKPTGALFLLDACQSLGQLPIDVERL